MPMGPHAPAPLGSRTAAKTSPLSANCGCSRSCCALRWSGSLNGGEASGPNSSVIQAMIGCSVKDAPSRRTMMAKVQPFLFENELPEKEQPVGLTLAPKPNRPLTKMQRAFNRLVTRVEELRARIAAETQVLDEALVYYGKHLHPRL